MSMAKLVLSRCSHKSRRSETVECSAEKDRIEVGKFKDRDQLDEGGVEDGRKV